MTERNLSFAAVGLAHGHIVQMCEGLIGAGARLKYICDGDREAETLFAAKFPGATIAPFDRILSDEEVGLVATAAVPGRRCGIGVRAMEAGKHFFSAKAPVVSSEQLRMLRKTAARTGRKVFVYYSERVASEAAVFAEKLIAAGKIGRVINVVILAPHKLGKRPDWFFSREDTGGILIDIGSHQFEQFLTYTGNGRAEIVASSVANFAHGEHPGFDDFGDAFLRGENGATGYIDTNFEGKAAAAIEEFRNGQDFVYIHVEAPDECGHRGEAENKRDAISLIDKKILGPVTAALEQMGDYKVLVMPDHATPLSLKTHTNDPIPFLIYDSTDPKQGPDAFDEAAAKATGLYLDEGFRMMQDFAAAPRR